MKILEKKKMPGGKRRWLLFGIPVLSYRKRQSRMETVVGSGNAIVNRPEKCKVIVFGNRNRIVFPEICEGFVGTVQIGAADFSANDCCVEIGEHIQANGLSIMVMEDGSKVKIGSDCLISSGVQFWASDTHAILDSANNVLNAGHGIDVGDHVWIGVNALVMKDVSIPDGCVIGGGSVVSGRIDMPPGSVVAGNPARVVKSGVLWSKSRPGALLRNSVISGGSGSL